MRCTKNYLCSAWVILFLFLFCTHCCRCQNVIMEDFVDDKFVTAEKSLSLSKVPFAWKY